MRSTRWSALGAALTLAVAAACSGGGSAWPEPQPTDTAKVALTDMGARTYLGFQGGLYPGAQNDPPAAHAAAGRAAAAAILPLDSLGRPSPGGRIVLLSIGMSNTTMEFCSGSYPSCAAVGFVWQARNDPEVNHTTLVLVDGARGGQTPPSWNTPSAPNYDSARGRLAKGGVTEAQVQVVWLKEADAQPTVSLPGANADAYALERGLGDMIRAMKVHYPNLRQVFLSNRIYGGYASTTLNPEPYAYETGFAVKWLIQAQIDQVGGKGADPTAGNLDYRAGAPWLAWGPYLWTNGTKGRSDGLVWLSTDVGTDGTHPSDTGRQKVATLLLQFFKSSPFTRCWFVAGQRCS